jgi:hypothetical protein
MKRGGHASPAAAQHATMDRDRTLAAALAAMVTGPAVVSLVPAERVTEEIRKKLPEDDGVEAIITPLTRADTTQSQRGSNPCSHLERVNRDHLATREYSQTCPSSRRSSYFCLRHGTRRNMCFSPS